MTAIQSTRFRPDSPVFKDLAWRACLVIIAVVGVLLEVPVWARAPLSIAAAVVTVWFFLSRFRTRGPLDAAITGIGLIVVILVLLGLVLNVLPSGISAASWAVGVGSVELVSLVGLAYWRAPRPMFRQWPRLRPSAIAWSLAIAVVLGGSLAWSINSFSASHVAPLTMSAVSSGESVVVTVTSGHDDGPYLLQVVTGSQRTTIAQDIRIGPGNPGSITVKVPALSREKVQLVRTGSTSPVREVILDTTINPTTTKVTR